MEKRAAIYVFADAVVVASAAIAIYVGPIEGIIALAVGSAIFIIVVRHLNNLFGMIPMLDKWIDSNKQFRVTAGPVVKEPRDTLRVLDADGVCIRLELPQELLGMAIF